MWTKVIGVIALYNIGIAVYMWFFPNIWYDGTPGVAAMGPFNLHFIRDVALTYLVSGLALMWGLRKQDKTALVFGALWPCLHAVFHIWIWSMRGFPFDQVFAVNIVGIQLPAWLALFAALKFTKRSRRHALGE